MQTVDKAMKLLTLFSIKQPEIGLSELARLSGYDKAATRRFLVALQVHDFIEQNPTTRAYRLGTGFLHLAKIREATFPLDKVIHAALERLSQNTQETAHATLLSDTRLVTLAVNFPNRANRVHLDIGEALPFHATASGVVYLAFADAQALKHLSGSLKAYTSNTNTDEKTLKAWIKEAHRQGYAMSLNGYEQEVTGIAVPYFNSQGLAMGTLAVATPSPRMDEALAASIRQQLIKESWTVTEALGGVVPAHFPKAIENP
jgi:DNA-binding IclR family transcriptional regulator